MTGRATFGDFAAAARAHLRDPARPGAPAMGHPAENTRAGPVSQSIRAMNRAVTVMAGYAADIAAVLAPPGIQDARVPGTWAHASLRAREAIQNAAAFVQFALTDSGQPGHPHPSDPAARQLDAAAAFLAAGRDLLHTHVAVRRDRTRVDHSEWAPAVTSQPVARALLLELGLCARRIAAHGSRLALPGPAARHGTGTERLRLNTACQWLWVFDTTVQAAQRRHPVTAEQIQLLHAIPVNARQPRRLPSATETVTSLCQGIAHCAERVRHGAVFAAPDPVLSPALTADAFSHTATCATVISHHCEILLHALATRARQHGSPGLATRLPESAQAAMQARIAWYHTARAWYRITTDTRGTITPAAAETADLALWTGRLAYADPDWTPAHGPAHPTRPPEDLAPEPRDLANVIAAVHQANETVTRIAMTDHGQIHAAAQAGRLLVPTRSLPDRFDIPHPFAPAPQDRVDTLLAAYHDAGTKTAQATAAISMIAADVRAPSHILTVARAATQGDSRRARNSTPRAQPVSEAHLEPDFPGPVERILHDLGVTSPATLARATAIDQLGEQLILGAAQTTEVSHAGLDAVGFSRSTGSAELINHMLASGSLSTAVLPPPSPPKPRSAGHEPTQTAANRRHIGHQNAWRAPEAEPEP